MRLDEALTLVVGQDLEDGVLLSEGEDREGEARRRGHEQAALPVRDDKPAGHRAGQVGVEGAELGHVEQAPAVELHDVDRRQSGDRQIGVRDAFEQSALVRRKLAEIVHFISPFHHAAHLVISTTQRGGGPSSSKPIPWRSNAHGETGLFEDY
jgi:hypothetical protein